MRAVNQMQGLHLVLAHLVFIKKCNLLLHFSRKSSNLCKVLILLKLNMRECWNWQTGQTKDLVIVAIVWVQVPSPALNILEFIRVLSILKGNEKRIRKSL